MLKQITTFALFASFLMIMMPVAHATLQNVELTDGMNPKEAGGPAIGVVIGVIVVALIFIGVWLGGCFGGGNAGNPATWGGSGNCLENCQQAGGDLDRCLTYCGQ